MLSYKNISMYLNIDCLICLTIIKKKTCSLLFLQLLFITCFLTDVISVLKMYSFYLSIWQRT